ncbi:unnamed protein product [Durusdinium trenchii]|uniref:Uncharacterized protein n=1 Tax=Durusdinium trenchii TaxID=1381693 RepID=A0ABP0NW00_9DINO
MSPPSISELSLSGLIARLKEVDHIKGIKSPDDEQAALLATETDVKKALFEELQGASSGIFSFEKKVAKEFLQTQIKSVDDAAKGADAKKMKLQELLSGVEGAASKEDPAHVRRARQDLAKAEKAFEEATKNYERWEKGKKMFSVDEIKALKRAFEEGKQKVEKARGLVEQQQQRRATAAVAPLTEEKERGAAAVATEARLAKSAKAPGKVANPAVSTKAAPAGYPKQPPPAALRQAQLAAQVRMEAQHPEEPKPAPAPRPNPRPRVEAPKDAPVLSYACTCSAVAEHLCVSEAQARDLAQSAGEFAQHFDEEVWQAIQDRSLAIEKANREKQREAERRKQEKALAKVTQVESSVANGANGQTTKVAAPQAMDPIKFREAAKAKPQPKPKAQGAPKAKDAKAPVKKLAVANRFGGMESDDDEEEGWTAVRR